MQDNVLNNHINYCIEHDISDLSEYFIKYLTNRKIKYYEKTEIIKYILKFYPLNRIIKELLNIVDFDTRISLIKSCSIYGLNKYYDILKTEMHCVDLNNSYRDTTEEAISYVNNIECLDIISKIYLLRFSPKFKDNKFQSLYSNCREAFIKMALANIQSNSHLLVIKKLQEIIEKNKDINNIGFTYYIIDEIKNRFYLLTKNQYNIQQVIDMCNSLFKEHKSTGLKY